MQSFPDPEWSCKKLALCLERRLGDGGGGTRTLLTPGLGRQKQEDFCEFKASLVYRVSFRTAKATQSNPVSTPPSKRVPSIHMDAHNHLYASYRRADALFWPLRALYSRAQTHRESLEYM